MSVSTSIVGWSSKLNWLKSLFETRQSLPYCTCYWLPERFNIWWSGMHCCLICFRISHIHDKLKHPWVGDLNLGCSMFIASCLKIWLIFNITSTMAFKVLLVHLAISMLLTSGTERSKEVSARGHRLCLCSDRVLRISSQDSEVSRYISFYYVAIGK